MKLMQVCEVVIFPFMHSMTATTKTLPIKRALKRDDVEYHWRCTNSAGATGYHLPERMAQGETLKTHLSLFPCAPS